VANVVGTLPDLPIKPGSFRDNRGPVLDPFWTAGLVEGITLRSPDGKAGVPVVKDAAITAAPAPDARTVGRLAVGDRVLVTGSVTGGNFVVVTNEFDESGFLPLSALDAGAGAAILNGAVDRASAAERMAPTDPAWSKGALPEVTVDAAMLTTDLPIWETHTRELGELRAMPSGGAASSGRTRPGEPLRIDGAAAVSEGGRTVTWLRVRTGRGASGYLPATAVEDSGPAFGLPPMMDLSKVATALKGLSTQPVKTGGQHPDIAVVKDGTVLRSAAAANAPAVERLPRGTRLALLALQQPSGALILQGRVMQDGRATGATGWLSSDDVAFAHEAPGIEAQRERILADLLNPPPKPAAAAPSPAATASAGTQTVVAGEAPAAPLAASTAATASGDVLVLTESSGLRESADAKAPKVGAALPPGTRLSVLERGEWAKVKVADGREGYVKAAWGLDGKAWAEALSAKMKAADAVCMSVGGMICKAATDALAAGKDPSSLGYQTTTTKPEDVVISGPWNVAVVARSVATGERGASGNPVFKMEFYTTKADPVWPPVVKAIPAKTAAAPAKAHQPSQGGQSAGGYQPAYQAQQPPQRVPGQGSGNFQQDLNDFGKAIGGLFR
jgi:hypothetical protein